MNPHATLLSRFWKVVVGGSLLLCAVSAPAQEAREIELRRIDATFVEPRQEIALARPAISRRWVQLEAEFDTRDMRAEWLDEITLKFFVLIRTRTTPRLFTGEVSYVNIPRQSENVALLYIHPNTVQRYMRGELPARVAVQMLVKGRPLAHASWPQASRERWWEQYTPEYGFIMAPKDTPFATAAYGLINQIKPTSTAITP
jgi:hypothetical protein